MKQGHTIFELPLRVVYYARVSTETDEQLNSLENQKNFFEDYIKNFNKWILVDSYIDEGLSGTSVLKRTSFLRMIEDAKKNKFDMILTKEVSRFARNTIDSIKYTNYLLENNVIVNFLNDNLNTIDETCEFRLTIMSSLAQDEVRRLSSRVKFGLARSVKDGKVLGGGNILGYHKYKGRLIIDNKEANMIRILYDLYISSKYSFKDISNKLYKLGYKNSKNKPYAPRVLSRIITNPKYKGYYCGNKSYIKDYKTHKKVMRSKDEWLIYRDSNIPSIVTEETWNLANKIYESKKKKYLSRKNYYNTSIYTGILVCKNHHCNFTRVSSNKRKNNPIWQCLEYSKYGLKGCISPLLKEKELDKLFNHIITGVLPSDICDSITKDYLRVVKDNTSIDNNEIEKINRVKQKLLELNVDGILSNKEFKIKNDNLNNELKNYHNNKNRNHIRCDINLLKERINDINNYEILFRLLVKKIYVSKVDNDRKKIKFDINFKNDRANTTIIYNLSKSL